MDLGGRVLSLETGRMAKQADGAVFVRYADTAVLATVVAAKEAADDRGFFPLQVEYREKAYAAGKIPGGFFKREGRPGEKEILSARLVDRPIRPLFPPEFMCEVQIIITVLSSDQENDADVLGLIGAATALSISDVPFSTPIAAVRVGIINGQYILNPTFSQLEESELDIVIAGSAESILMVEGRAKEIPEGELLRAIRFGHENILRIIDLERELISVCGVPKREVPPLEVKDDLIKAVSDLCRERIHHANSLPDKEQRQKAIDDTIDYVIEQLSEQFPDSEKIMTGIVYEIEKQDMRRLILDEGRRVDGRGLEQIRPISCEVGVLPRTHGSALFTRGQTQSLAVATLGTKMDEQRIDDLVGESWKSYMLHYNFPPFSVGEVRPIRGPGRREIGHGALAERSIEPMIPSDEVFPYTIRIVSDVLESNGSSSMATVCAGTLALMDAGVPIKEMVAGIAMGLVKEGDRVAILTDILGIEDHLGDMDFKVTGSRNGITGFQMDIKMSGISYELLEEALSRAKAGRLHILDIMAQTIPTPRSELSKYAPRITLLRIPVDKIGEVIGPGGKIIRSIIEQSGAKIDIEDDGTVTVAATEPESSARAVELIESIVAEPEIGKVYPGIVKKTTSFGAFVEFMPGKEGMVHISDLEWHRVNRVEDVVNVGDEITVKVIGIDPLGKVKLSRKATLEPPRKTPGNFKNGGHKRRFPSQHKRRLEQ
jgi:polyribonucleotide nucleotidyltransferase